jgi:hypothetical protein
MDIDSREGLIEKLKILGFCAYGVANAYIFIKVSWLLGLLMLPVFAWFASRYIVHGLVDDAPYWRRWLMYRKWNGAYFEFDGRQIRVEDFGGDSSEMPLVAVEDLENLFKDKARFRIKEGFMPVSGLLENIASVPADKAVAWAQLISRTANTEAERAKRLALYIERTFVTPKLKHDYLNTVKGPSPELWGLKPKPGSESGEKEES